MNSSTDGEKKVPGVMNRGVKTKKSLKKLRRKLMPLKFVDKRSEKN